jgi:hypothetical protein
MRRLFRVADFSNVGYFSNYWEIIGLSRRINDKYKTEIVK